jgi:hypothetical protein
MFWEIAAATIENGVEKSDWERGYFPKHNSLMWQNIITNFEILELNAFF